MTRRRFGRHVVDTSNEDKPLFPGSGITKGDVIAHYERVADHALPWLRERPLVLQRFPDGIGSEGFYQKQAADHFPDWVRTVEVPLREGGSQRLVVCDRKATLVYLADQACLTLHPWLSRTDRLDHPDQLVIDLDPPGDDFPAVRRAARACRDLLEELELPAFLKTTGSKGLHVSVPLDRSAGFDEVRDFARDLVERLARRRPRELTTEVRRARRRGRLFLDVARNAFAQTAVAPFALRPLPGAPVATPIAWDELGRVGPRRYRIDNVGRRLAQVADPWAGMRRRAVGVAAARRRLEALGD